MLPQKSLSEAERLDWLRLSRTENVGPVTFIQLMQRYGEARAALEALPELAERGGMRRKLTVPSVAAIKAEISATEKLGARMIALCEPDYPKPLAHIYDPPPIITVQGHAHLWHKPCVAMVGARNASLNGRRFAERLARELGQAGWVVVSGLAVGIDAAAHQGALATGTVGVIAGGIENIYPPENKALYEAMREQGVVMTENPVGTEIRPQLFPRRNRIESGLSLGVVVIEAALKSGSLITARLALEQGREVLAVPGSPLDPRSGGTNRLLKDGAVLVETAADIISALGKAEIREQPMPVYAQQPLGFYEETDLSSLRKQILNALSVNPVPVDEVIRLCQTPLPMVWAALLELELAGLVQRLPGGQVALIGNFEAAAAD